MSHNSDQDLDIINHAIYIVGMRPPLDLSLQHSPTPATMTSCYACTTVVSRSEISVFFIIVTGVTAFQKCHANYVTPVGRSTTNLGGDTNIISQNISIYYIL
jgi:hypothetical protein